MNWSLWFRRWPVFVEKGGPHGHSHKGSRGCPGGRGVVAGGILKSMMPEQNREELDIPETGLPDAKSLDGLPITRLAYNPKTGTLLAGTQLHANLIHRYGGGTYDDYVKISYSPWAKEIAIDAMRVNARDSAEAWGLGFKAAKALKSAGFPRETPVTLKMKDLDWIEQELGEMTS